MTDNFVVEGRRRGVAASEAAADARSRMVAHEELCALRYQGIIDRLTRLEKIVISTGGALILFLAGLLATMIIHLPVTPPH
jgi:hypothetical protein